MRVSLGLVRRTTCILAFLLVITLARGSASAGVITGTIWINEFHYDNAGTDQGEFVEVLAPVSFVDLWLVTLTRYDGQNGLPYSSPGGITSYNLRDHFRRGSTVSGYHVYVLDLPSGGLQNGPDGLALVHGDAGVLQFLSYEGSFLARGGPAAGWTSTNVGVFEPANAPLGVSLQLIGTGDRYEDFTWSGPAVASPGWLNTSQTLTEPTSVPEPSSIVLASLAGVLASGYAGLRRWKAGGRGSCRAAQREQISMG